MPSFHPVAWNNLFCCPTATCREEPHHRPLHLQHPDPVTPVCTFRLSSACVLSLELVSMFGLTVLSICLCFQSYFLCFLASFKLKRFFNFCSSLNLILDFMTTDPFNTPTHSILGVDPTLMLPWQQQLFVVVNLTLRCIVTHTHTHTPLTVTL